MISQFLDYAAEFYIGFFHSTYYYSSFYPYVIITTTEKQPVLYSIEAPGEGYYKNGIITADHEVILNLPSNLSVSSFYYKDIGVCIKTSSKRVTVQGVHQIAFYYYDYGPYVYKKELETFVAIPVIDLCSSEYIYYAISVDGYSSDYNSSVLIVGTEDNTTIILTVTQLATVSVGSIAINLTPGKEYSLVINRLQTGFIESFSDLTGSRIVTDKQVSVFSGHEFGYILDSPSSHLVEQIPPTVLWGKVHFVIPLKDALEGYAIKIVTSNECVIKIYCNSSSLPIFTTTLNSGEFLVKEFSNNEFCTIESTSEVLIAQFSLGRYYSYHDDVFMALVPSKKQYHNNFRFMIINDNITEIHYSYGNNNNYGYVNIIVTARYFQPGKIYLIADGNSKSLDNELWQPIKVHNITEAYATQVNITYDTAEIYHKNVTAQIAVMVYGFSYRGSHGTAISSHINKGTYSIDMKLHTCIFVLI